MTRVFADERIGTILHLALLSLLQVLLALVGAFCVQQVFDRLLVETSAPPTHAIGLAVLFGLSVFATAALEVRRLTTAERLSLGYIAALRTAMFDRIMRAAPETIHRRREGGLLLPFVGDLTAVKKWVGDGLARTISASVTLIFLLCALFWLSPILAACAAGVLVVAVLCAFVLSGPLMRAIRRVRSRRGALANFVSSSARAAATVRAFNRLDRERQRLERRTEALTHAGVRLARLSGLMSALAFAAGGVLVALTLGFGVFAPSGQSLTAGVLAGAISLTGLASTAIRDLGMSFEFGKRAQASFAKIKVALAIAPSVRSVGRARDRLSGEGTLALEAVAVAGAFDRVDVSANAGDVVCIEGPSGSGKSLLASLIVRLRDPDSGLVTFDGVDIRRLPARTLGRAIGFAGAAVPLMRGTVLMNLKYRAPRVGSDEFADVMQLCGVDDLVERLPHGEQCKLSEGAPELSRGDQQRLMIARAMLGAPPVLVLDEVDSHLDDETAARLADAFAGYPGLIVMAAASPSWRRVATTNWTIENRTLKATSRSALASVADAVVAPIRSAL